MKSRFTLMKKMTALVIAAALGFLTLVPANTEARADTMTEVTPAYMKSMDAYDSTVKLSYEHGFEMPKGTSGQEKSDVVKLVVPRDSVVRIDMQFYESSDSPDFFGMSWGYVEVYTNAALTQKALRKQCHCGSQESPQVAKALISLTKGTYYVKVIAHRNSYSDVDETIQARLFMTAISTKDAFSVSTKKVSGGKYNLSFKNNLGTELNGVYYEKGTYRYDKYDSNLKPVEAGASSVKITNPGKYSVVFAFDDGQTKFDLTKYNTVVISVNVKSADNTKPVISGVKNGKTYKKAVIVKFSDKDSGIKSARLNGKSVSSGKKITKNGSYTLVVEDKSGNKNIVKFKIKK